MTLAHYAIEPHRELELREESNVFRLAWVNPITQRCIYIQSFYEPETALAAFLRQCRRSARMV